MKKLALVMVLAGVAVADTQAEIAARSNQQGVDLMLASKFADAAAKFQDAFARVPDAKYAFNLCTADFQQGKFGEALTACQASLNLSPSPELTTKVDKLIARIKGEAANQHLDVESDRDDAAKLNEEGKARMYDGEFDKAELKFTAAAAKVPEPIYFFNLCAARFQLGKLASAIDACKSVAAHKPTRELADKTEKMKTRIRDEARHQGVKLD